MVQMLESQIQLQVGLRRCYTGQYFVLADLPDNRRAAFRMLREKAYQKPKHAKVYQEQIRDMVDHLVRVF